MSRNSLNVLTIGNSFTDSLTSFFQDVAESAGCTLHFERANHGGCELHRHWSYIQHEEADSEYSLYQDRKFKMREILARESWDVVTIQQGSHFSWRKETFQPFADHICDYIHRHAPSAEIVIQQTWSYRADDPRFLPNGTWKFDEAYLNRIHAMGATVNPGPFEVTQESMYHDLTEAYLELAKERNLRIIPTGYAVQTARSRIQSPFRNYDPNLLKTLKWPDLPPQSGDVVGNMGWRKNQQTGEMEIGRDCIHLNVRGQYLQACVWFAFLYGRSTEEIKFVPDSIANSDAEMLRNAAQFAVDNFRQIKS